MPWTSVRRVRDWDEVDEIVIETSRHTHNVIGTGANDPQKFDPGASRETLDHSIMYIAAVALQDGTWHHVRSYRPERARRPDTVALWRKIRTVEDPRWTERYHARDPRQRAFGGRIVLRMKDGSIVADELAVANAHTLGSTPWARPDYLRKFRTLTEGLLETAEAERFLDVAQRLPHLEPEDLAGLTLTLPGGVLAEGRSGIF